jgi:transposase
LLAYKRGEPRVCAMLRVPTPEEEDRRRITRKRKALTNERVRHVDRVKGLQFAQGVSGYEPLRCNRRKGLEPLKTGDGRPLPSHLKAQISRELDRLKLLLEQIKAVETARDAMLAATQVASSAPAMLLDLKGIRPEFAALVVGGAVASLRQPTTSCRLCGPCADTLAERLGRLQPGGIESPQSKAANDADADGLAVAAPSTAISSNSDRI